MQILSNKWALSKFTDNCYHQECLCPYFICICKHMYKVQTLLEYLDGFSRRRVSSFEFCKVFPNCSKVSCPNLHSYLSQQSNKELTCPFRLKKLQNDILLRAPAGFLLSPLLPCPQVSACEQCASWATILAGPDLSNSVLKSVRFPRVLENTFIFAFW